MHAVRKVVLLVVNGISRFYYSRKYTKKCSNTVDNRSILLRLFSLFQMYGEEFEEQEEETVIGSLGEHDSKKEKKTGRKASEQGHGSPLKRKESFARRDK